MKYVQYRIRSEHKSVHGERRALRSHLMTTWDNWHNCMAILESGLPLFGHEYKSPAFVTQPSQSASLVAVATPGFANWGALGWPSVRWGAKYNWHLWYWYCIIWRAAWGFEYEAIGSWPLCAWSRIWLVDECLLILCLFAEINNWDLLPSYGFCTETYVSALALASIWDWGIRLKGSCFSIK